MVVYDADGINAAQGNVHGSFPPERLLLIYYEAPLTGGLAVCEICRIPLGRGTHVDRRVQVHYHNGAAAPFILLRHDAIDVCFINLHNLFLWDRPVCPIVSLIPDCYIRRHVKILRADKVCHVADGAMDMQVAGIPPSLCHVDPAVDFAVNVMILIFSYNQISRDRPILFALFNQDGVFPCRNRDLKFAIHSKMAVSLIRYAFVRVVKLAVCIL